MTWKPGDIAICVSCPPGPWVNHLGASVRGPELDAAYLVVDTRSGTDIRGTGLRLAGLPGFYLAFRFRKADPVTLPPEEVKVCEPA